MQAVSTVTFRASITLKVQQSRSWSRLQNSRFVAAEQPGTHSS